MCIIASTGFNYNDFNVINAMIRVVKMDSHRVEFLVFTEETWLAKRRHNLVFVSPTYCIPHLLHEITYITLGVSHWDLVLIV